MKIDLGLITAFALPVFVWLGISAAGNGGEAWDSAGYWSVGLPAIYLAGSVAALLTARNVWQITLWSGLGQFAGLITTAAGLSLWPLGLMLIAVLSLPVAGVAAATRWIRRRLG
jgi:hypothetical protein